MSCSHKATSPVGHLPTCRPRTFGYQERMRFCRCACSSVFGQQGARTTRYSLNWWWRSECRDTSRAQKPVAIESVHTDTRAPCGYLRAVISKGGSSYTNNPSRRQTERYWPSVCARPAAHSRGMEKHSEDDYSFARAESGQWVIVCVCFLFKCTCVFLYYRLWYLL